MSKPAIRPEPVVTPEIKLEPQTEELVHPMVSGNAAPAVQAVQSPAPKNETDYLDIPAFLRKQAD
uniref:Cell division protein FtsZ n=1 Tax=Shewanella eurypsychrophilus TaxID=2593656 RepID=A0A7S9IWH2_9GAMM